MRTWECLDSRESRLFGQGLEFLEGPLLSTFVHGQHNQVCADDPARYGISGSFRRQNKLYDNHFPGLRQRLPTVVEHLNATLIVLVMEDPLYTRPNENKQNQSLIDQHIKHRAKSQTTPLLHLLSMSRVMTQKIQPNKFSEIWHKASILVEDHLYL